MKYYIKDTLNNLFAFEDDNDIPQGLIPFNADVQENGLPYSDYLEADGNGFYAKDVAAVLAKMKVDKIITIKNTTDLKIPVVIDGITFNGGAGSASAINGGIELASQRLEDMVSIWDINDEVSEFSMVDAVKIVLAIAVDYRTNALARQTRITEVNAIVVDVNGTYPTIEDAIAAIELIEG